MNELCHVHDWVLDSACACRCHVCEIWLICMQNNAAFVCKTRHAFLCERWLIRTWDTTHLCVCDIVCVSMLWLIRMQTHAAFTCKTRCAFICETSLICTWDMTHLYVRHESFVCMISHSHVGHESVMCPTCIDICIAAICATWLLRTWDMTQLYVQRHSIMMDMNSWRDSSIQTSVSWLFVWHDWILWTPESLPCAWYCSIIRNTKHSYVWYDACVRVAWLIYTCGLTHGAQAGRYHACVKWLNRACDDPFHVTWIIATCHNAFIGVTCVYVYILESHISTHGMSHVTANILASPIQRHFYAWHDSFLCVAWIIPLCDMTHSCTYLHHRYDLNAQI